MKKVTLELHENDLQILAGCILSIFYRDDLTPERAIAHMNNIRDLRKAMNEEQRKDFEIASKFIRQNLEGIYETFDDAVKPLIDKLRDMLDKDEL